MVETSIRHRVLLEPRGFIRVIELVLAIVAFATTGGYHSESTGTLKCGETSEAKEFKVPISYPFNLEAYKIMVPKCNASGSGYEPEDAELQLTGDFSPTSQWFVFVGVMAFLICLATIIFYVAFETSVRATNEHAVTVTDLVVTAVWAFLWLTAASAWAWGVNQVKTYGDANAAIKFDPLKSDCATSGNVCRQQHGQDYGSLNASVAFAFLSFIVWAGNVWFVYKETPYHDDQANLTPNEGMPSQEVPTAQ